MPDQTLESRRAFNEHVAAFLVSVSRSTKVSDVIAALEGCPRNYLCHYLEVAEYRAADSATRNLLRKTIWYVVDFCWLLGVGSSLAGVMREIVKADFEDIPASMKVGFGSIAIKVESPEWRAIRDKWCRDYAAFLREFGL